MFDPNKQVVIGQSALKHGLSAEYIQEMWYSQAVEGFEVARLPPRETNIIVIRFVSQPNGTVEMIAEDESNQYFIFHACFAPEGEETNLMREAFELFGMAADGRWI